MDSEAIIVAANPPLIGSLEIPAVDHRFKRAAFRGSLYTFLSQILMVLIQTGTMLGLARLLSPTDFGLFAMVVWVSGFLFLFKDLGLSIVTVQRPKLVQAEASFLFWANVAVCCILGVVALLLAPLLGSIYHEKRLVAMMAALALGIVIHGFGIQHQSILNRQLRLALIGAIDVGSVLFSSVAGIICAWKGGGPWALVLTQVSFFAINTVLLSSFSGWRPGRPVWIPQALELLGLGGSLTGVNVVSYFSRNTDSILLGYFWGPGALGYYTRASQLLLQPSLQIGALLRTVLVPTLSRLNGEPIRFRKTACDILANISRFSMPIVAWMIATADWVIIVLLGNKWSEAAVIFRCLGIAALLQPMTITVTYILVSQGRSRDLLQSAGVSSLLVTMAILLGLKWGPIGAAVSVSAGELFLRLPCFVYTVGRRGPVTSTNLFVACLPGIAPALLVFGGIEELRHYMPEMDPLVGLIYSGMITLVLGGGAVYFLPGGRLAWDQVKSLLKRSASPQSAI